MSQIFISYAKEDRSTAKMLAETLEQKGYSVWWDRKIPPGRTFDEVIEENLDAAECVVVMWSKKAAKSHWVKEEVNDARQQKILGRC